MAFHWNEMKANGYVVWINVNETTLLWRFESFLYHSAIVLLCDPLFSNDVQFLVLSSHGIFFYVLLQNLWQTSDKYKCTALKFPPKKYKSHFFLCIRVFFFFFLNQRCVGDDSFLCSCCPTFEITTVCTLPISSLSPMLSSRTPSIKLINSNCLLSLCLPSHHIRLQPGGLLWI